MCVCVCMCVTHTFYRHMYVILTLVCIYICLCVRLSHSNCDRQADSKGVCSLGTHSQRQCPLVVFFFSAIFTFDFRQSLHMLIRLLAETDVTAVFAQPPFPLALAEVATAAAFTLTHLPLVLAELLPPQSLHALLTRWCG